jgi:hypothetical protein
MVPLPTGGIFNDLTNGTGAAGQNSPTPAEKFFTAHFIIKAPMSGVGGPYFDPSYGITYSSACDFESKSVAAYANPVVGTNYYSVRPQWGGCSVTLNP